MIPLAVTFDSALGTIFPILTVITGGACILLFSVTTTLRQSNGDLRDRVSDLEASDVRKDATIKEQAAELVALQKIVTGEVQLTALADVLDMHHRETIVSTARIEHGVDTILQKVSNL